MNENTSLFEKNSKQKMSTLPEPCPRYCVEESEMKEVESGKMQTRFNEHPFENTLNRAHFPHISAQRNTVLSGFF